MAFSSAVLPPGWIRTGRSTGNAIGSTVATDKMGFRGIFLQNAQNFAISNNTINGVVSSTSSSSTMSGIHVAGTLNTGSILATASVTSNR